MTEVTEPFATAKDLEARWRPLIQSETQTAETLLLDASQLIVDEGFDPEAIPEATLRRVTCAVVKRAMSAPTGVGIGVESTQFGAGPFQESLKYSNPMGDLYLTKADRRALGSGHQKAFEIDLMPAAAAAVRYDIPPYLGWLP